MYYIHYTVSSVQCTPNILKLFITDLIVHIYFYIIVIYIIIIKDCSVYGDRFYVHCTVWHINIFLKQSRFFCHKFGESKFMFNFDNSLHTNSIYLEELKIPGWCLNLEYIIKNTILRETIVFEFSKWIFIKFMWRQKIILFLI